MSIEKASRSLEIIVIQVKQCNPFTERIQMDVYEAMKAICGHIWNSNVQMSKRARRPCNVNKYDEHTVQAGK